MLKVENIFLWMYNIEDMTQFSIERDFWLDMGPELSSPKLQVGHYVAGQGYPVPAANRGLLVRVADVQNWDVSFLARSEGPDQYDGQTGPSGLLDSYLIDPAAIEGRSNPITCRLGLGRGPGVIEMQALAGGLQYTDDSGRKVPTALASYLEMTGQNPVRYLNTCSYSYWDNIPGVNLTVAADDAVEGRRYIFARDGKGFDSPAASVVCDVDGDVEFRYDYKMTLAPDVVRRIMRR
jgi:hypothetical protein